MANDVMMRLLAMNLAAAAAILAVLALRRLARATVGAQAAYALWLIVPTVMLAGLLPPRTISLPAPMAAAVAPVATVATPPAIMGKAPSRATAPADVLEFAARPFPGLSQILVGVWLSGVAVSLALLLVGQRRALAQFGGLVPDAHDPSVTRASNPKVGPALLGTVRPRVVVPADFEVRFDAKERAMILAHERTHLARGHAAINALVALLKAVHWFNPLIHLGARCARVDQELACDAAVMERFPGDRQAYAQALLKTQLVFASLPLGCYWPERSPSRLEERIGMLAQKAPGRLRLRIGACVIASLTACAGLAAWASEPPVTKVSPAAPPAAGPTAAQPAPAQPASALASPPQGPPPETQPVAAAAQPAPDVAKPDEPPIQIDASAPAQPEPAKPIVLAAVQPALSPVPAVAPAQVEEHKVVVASLSQTAPDSAAPDAAPASQPDGDWGVMDSLAGKSFSGNVEGGVGVIRFRKGANNTYTMSFGEVGVKPSTVVLTLIAKDIAAISYVEGPAIAPRGKARPAYNQVDLKTDGFVIEWNSSKGCVVRPGSAMGCFFSRLVSDSGVQITTFLVKDGQIIENASSPSGGRVVFKPFG